MLLFLNGYHSTTKISQSYFRCVTLYIHKISCSYQVYRRKYSRLFIVELYVYHYYYLTSHNLLFFSLYKTSKKQHFRVSVVLFSRKIVKSLSLKLNISKTAWQILMILVSFCRILGGLSDEINLFWCCFRNFRCTVIKVLLWNMYEFGEQI